MYAHVRKNHMVIDRKGKITKEDSAQDRFLRVLYGTAFGRKLLKVLISPAFSKMGGWLLDTRLSSLFIPGFVRSHHIDMEAYEKKKYRSYNEFFQRRLAPGARTCVTAKKVLISPCDSRLSVYKIDEKNTFSIKDTPYTVESLLRSRKLAKAFRGGYLWVFRLCVDDYHRYIYVDEGHVSRSVKIRGLFHTVNPVANDCLPIYKENTREYVLIRTEHFGTLLQMEVGAMLVGKIENHPVKGNVCRGQEKGAFAFGGSTVILMTQPGKVRPDHDLLEYTAKGMETKVKMGERIGIRIE